MHPLKSGDYFVYSYINKTSTNSKILLLKSSIQWESAGQHVFNLFSGSLSIPFLGGKLGLISHSGDNIHSMMVAPLFCRALTEKIVSVLPKMKCPHCLEPHQIQGLDYIHIFPVIQVRKYILNGDTNYPYINIHNNVSPTILISR